MTTSGGRRQLDDLRAGIEAWCTRHRPDLAALGVAELTHPSAGLTNETVIVRFDTTRPDGPKLVVRLPPLLETFPDADLEREVRVQQAVAGFGVPTVAPITYEPDPSWLGQPFAVMGFVDGDIPGDASLFDPWLTEATPGQRREAQRELVRTLAAIHAVDWRAAGLDDLRVGPAGRLVEQVDWWGGYLRWAMAGQPMPRIDAAFDWCRAHQPDDGGPPVLVWGDARLGNLVMDGQRRTRAVLDWELATVGPAEMDLGWYLGLERVLHELMGREPPEGMAPPAEVVDDYEQATGRPVVDLAWHMIFAVLRSIAVNVRQATISAEAGVPYLIPAGEANPLVGVVERWITDHPNAAEQDHHPWTPSPS